MLNLVLSVVLDSVMHLLTIIPPDVKFSGLTVFRKSANFNFSPIFPAVWEDTVFSLLCIVG